MADLDLDEPQLPPELFGAIICLLQDDITSLKAISVTYNLLRNIARPHLYKSVLVTIRHPQPSTDPTTIPLLFDIPGFNPKNTTEMTLKSSPHIMLKLSSPSLDLPVDKFINLHTLTVSRVHLERFLSFPRADAFSRQITTLRIHRLYYADAKDLMKFILAFPSVRCFSIHVAQDTINTRQCYELGAETPPLALLPPIQCINSPFDLSSEFTLALLNTLRPKQCVKRVSIVTSLTSHRAYAHLWKAFESFATMVPIWDLGLIFQKSPYDIYFSRPTNLHSLTLSLLNCGTTKKHALSFVFLFCQLELGSPPPPPNPFQNLRSLTLSFESPSTSRQDIFRTLAIKLEDGSPLKLHKSDMLDICAWPNQGRQGTDFTRDKFHSLNPNLNNTWVLFDARLSKSDGFPSLEELVVEVKCVKRAVSVGNGDSVVGTRQNPESEMEVDDLEALVMGLLPLCIERGIEVRAKLGSVVRVSGLWDDHDCSHLPSYT